MLATRTLIRSAARRTGTILAANSFEGGSNTTAITNGNSGGASGNALDVIAGTVTYSSTHARGTLAGALANGSSQLGWNSTTLGSGVTDAYGRGYWYFTGLPTGLMVGLAFWNTAGATSCGFMGIGSSGKVGIYNTASALQVAMTNTIPQNGWFRLEVTIHSHASTGSMTIRMYATDNVTLTEQISISNINTNGASIDKMYAQGQNGVTPIYIDDLAYSKNGWVGP